MPQVEQEQVPELVPMHKPLLTDSVKADSSQTTTKTKSKSPEQRISVLNRKLGLLYRMPEYEKLKATDRNAIDSVVYDRLVSKTYKRVGQTPLSKVNWLSLHGQEKLSYIQDNLRPNPRVHWTSGEEYPSSFKFKQMEGMLEPGNIELWNRPILKNQDGTYSTTLSFSIGTDKGEVLIPQVINGKKLTREQAIEHYRKTGEKLGVFDTSEHADAYATALHNEQAKVFPKISAQKVEENKVMQAELSSTDRAKIYSAKFLKGALDLASGISKDFAWLTKETAYPQDEKKQAHYQELAEHYLDKPKSQVDAYVKQYEPAINRDLRTKLFAGTAGFIPDLMAWELSPTKLGFEKNLADKLLNPHRLGEFSDFLYSSPIGKTIARATKGAIDGYWISTLHGHPSIGEAASFAAYEVGTPIAGKGINKGLGYVSETTREAASKMYSKLGNLYGSNFVFDYAKLATRQLGVKLTDPLLRQLSEVNHKVLNDFAKEFYGQTYSFLKPAEKKEVNKEINSAIANGFKYPALYDRKATGVAIEGELARLARTNPEVAANIQKLKDLTKQTTGKEVLSGAIEDVQKKTAISKGDTPASKAKEISEIGKKSKPKLELSDKSVVKRKTLPTSEAKLGPGAATRHSKEFTDSTMRRALALKTRFEKLEDQHTLQYWMALNGEYPKNLADKVISSFEHEHGKEEADALVNGLVTHTDKLFKTGHLTGESARVFRSGKYVSEDFRKKYGTPKTIWQYQLDIEHELLSAKGVYRNQLKRMLKEIQEDAE